MPSRLQIRKNGEGIKILLQHQAIYSLSPQDLDIRDISDEIFLFFFILDKNTTSTKTNTRLSDAILSRGIWKKFLYSSSLYTGIYRLNEYIWWFDVLLLDKSLSMSESCIRKSWYKSFQIGISIFRDFFSNSSCDDTFIHIRVPFDEEVLGFFWLVHDFQPLHRLLILLSYSIVVTYIWLTYYEK